jgi:hypothetical protein
MTSEEAARRRPRVMTAAEYWAWCRTGDDISHPSQATPFLNTLTILLTAEPVVIGRFADPT